MSGQISVLVVDDHTMLAEGVAAYLRTTDDVAVRGVAGNGQQVRAALADQPVDVVLMDFRLPDTSGDELAREVMDRWPGTKVLMITANDDDEVVARALAAGCHGFLPKGRTAGQLLSAVRSIHGGEAVFDPVTLARALPRMSRHRGLEVGDDLTPREREVLQLLANGLTTAAIAEHLVLSRATVRNHIQNTLTKLNAHSKLEAVTVALRHRLVTSS